MFSKARLDSPSNGIFGVTVTLLVLEARLREDFPPGQRRSARWPTFPPCVPILAFVVSVPFVLTFVASRIVRLARALYFGGPMIWVWSKRAAALD